MSVSAPESVIVLEDADQQKIELVNRRLATLQREVLAATQELSTLDNEIISTQKEKKYEEGQLIEVAAKVEALRNDQQELTLAVSKSQKELESHRDEHTGMNSKHASKEGELAARETTILNAEKEYSERALKLEISERTLEKDRAEVENARNMFLDAVASVTWK